MGLPKANRLQKRQDFQAVYRYGVCRKSTHLTLRALAKTQKKGEERKLALSFIPTRIGISISQKVSKKAVIRNRIKRRIRAALRELLPSLLPGWQIVVVVHPQAIECEYEHFLRELKELLVKTETIDGH